MAIIIQLHSPSVLYILPNVARYTRGLGDLRKIHIAGSRKRSQQSSDFGTHFIKKHVCGCTHRLLRIVLGIGLTYTDPHTVSLSQHIMDRIEVAIQPALGVHHADNSFHSHTHSLLWRQSSIVYAMACTVCVTRIRAIIRISNNLVTHSHDPLDTLQIFLVI